MSKYIGWAIRLTRINKFMNDATGDVACALFSTRREARAYVDKYHYAKGEAVVVRVAVTVKACK